MRGRTLLIDWPLSRPPRHFMIGNGNLHIVNLYIELTEVGSCDGCFTVHTSTCKVVVKWQVRHQPGTHL